MLNDRGVKVTQATVSRDIKDLRLIKVLTEGGSYKYATVDKAEAGLDGQIHKHICPFGCIHGRSGKSYSHKDHYRHGSCCGGSYRFNAPSDDIVGTMAGDNTIFVAVKDPAVTPELIKRFRDMLKA